MGNKVARFMRNYDAERRALKLLSRNEKAPVRAPRFESEREMLRQVAKDPNLDEAVNKKDASLLENLSKVKVVSSDPVTPQKTEQQKQQRPLPQRRYYMPIGELGVPEVPPETVPPGRLTLMQFQELLNTRQPQGTGLPSEKVQELLDFYAPLMQRSANELKQLTHKDKDGAAQREEAELK
ncbi:hypothetical protein BOX15_Mlig009219g3 [Macrostomum lignano]|uniref:Coiled-coil domain-containing protein n=2 Tax=Macrostomum lignano TaxID=282301 RepID=A0A1I8J0W1_9PLAT|nr:hypothetical protein BOX15_Mlig009219g1 [Macrostomum lignano]PAA75216.1 hypothetical protein BOX15_Mlig009219g3 [Macrostomum lignano]